MYITDFLSDSYSILNYNDFLTKWGLTGADVSANTYVNIKMAIEGTTVQRLPHEGDALSR